MPVEAISNAVDVHRVAERYPICVALHTDHYQAKMLDQYVIPLIEETEERSGAAERDAVTPPNDEELEG